MATLTKSSTSAQRSIPRSILKGTMVNLELKTAAPKTNVGVTAYDIQTAIKEHDKQYLNLKYR